MKANTDQRGYGVLLVVASFALWGVLPVYWKALHQVPSAEILAHRIFWSLIFTGALLALTSRRAELARALRDGRKRLYMAAAAIMICANWWIYIVAVNTGHILESSLGYFITPLLNVLLGLLVLRERLNAAQVTALILATAGVAIRIAQYGSVPWVSLGLALTFATYGLLKKVANLDAIVGLFVETAVLAPLALGFLALRHAAGVGAFGAASVSVTVLLAGAGIITATPLLLFAAGTRRVPLATVGFAQYVSPTLILCLGVFVYKETFTGIHALSFGLIWAALAVYSLSHVRWFAARAAKASAGPE
ncbi:MAG: EamA family transporter RarD [Bacteroidota bacterium]